jgi:hypothetical protein
MPRARPIRGNCATLREEGHGKKQWVYSFDLKPGVFGKDDEPKIRIVIDVTND